MHNPYGGTFPDLPLLLTDGTVIVHEGCTPNWSKLTPDKNGKYVNGTWSAAGSMPADYGPLYFASQVLADGRVIVNGGLYNNCSYTETNKGALYDPVSNTWTAVSPPTGWSTIGEAPSVIRTDKVYQVADCCSTNLALATIRGSTVTWTVLTGAQTSKDDANTAEGWTTLPDQHILTVDTGNCFTDETSCTEIFDTDSNMWSDGERTCGQLVDSGHNIGPAALLPNGFVFAAGATTTNCIMDAATGQWYPAPVFGGTDVARGAPAAVLPNGRLLIQTSPTLHSPSHFFEVEVKDVETVSVNQVDGPASAADVSSFDGRMLVLPTGQVLWINNGGNDIQLYSPKGFPKPAWAPKISGVSQTLDIGSKNNKILGRNFNGFTFGGYYGAAAQTATNYPLVRLTNAASGHVCYARTHDHNRMGIADGRKSSTKFDIPRSCETGDSALEVVANGIASAAVQVTLQ